jgi:hypothetical protein
MRPKKRQTMGEGDLFRTRLDQIICKIWYSISQTVSDLSNIHDRSIRAFAAKARAFGAPLSGFGA